MKVYGWMTGVESVQKGLKELSRIRPYTKDVKECLHDVFGQ